MTSSFGLLAFLSWDHDWNSHAFAPIPLMKALDQLQELGVGFVRLDILWSDIHRGTGQFDFSKYDRLISLLEQRKLGVLGLLQYNKTYEESGQEVWNRPPDSIDEFATYVGTTVQRYKSWIQHWEIWNEPNHPLYWSGPADNLQRYSQLLVASYRAAKQADPRCLVLNGGLTGPIVADTNHLYNSAGKTSFDILNIHPFINPLRKNALEQLDCLLKDVHEVMTKNGDAHKKIWITELGCPGVPPGATGLSWFEGEALNEAQQAQWLRDVFGFTKNRPYIESVFWAFYRDTEGIFNDATDYFGLVRSDLSPKPAFHAYKEIIAEHK